VDPVKASVQAALEARQADATLETVLNSSSAPTSGSGSAPSPNSDPSPVGPMLVSSTGTTDGAGAALEPLCLPNKLRAVSLGGRPQGITAVGDRLYVALSQVNSLMVVDTGMDMMLGSSRTTARQIGSVTASADAIYIGDMEGERLIVTSRQGAVQGEIKLSATPGPVAVTEGRGFVLHPQIGAISVVDLNTKEVISTLSLGPDPRQIAVIGGRAFIAHAAGFLNVVDGYGRRQEQLHLPINDLSGMAINAKAGMLYIASAADQKIVAVDVNTWTLARTWTLDTMPASLAYNEVTDHLFALDTTSQYLTILSGLHPERVGRIQVNNRPASDGGNNLVVLQGKLYIVHPSNDYLDVWLDRTCGVELAAHTQTVVAASYTRTDLAPRQVEARIGILWPHGGATPGQATFANLTATLIREDGASPACGWEPTVTLWAAIGDAPAQPIATGDRRLMTEAGVTYPVYDFNDVDVRIAHEQQLPIHFTVHVDGVETAQNVWTHSTTGQYLPTVRPELEGMVARHDGALDARIWVEKTAQGPQIYAMILRAGTMLGIAQSAGGAVPQLRWSLDNGVTEPELIVGQAETRQEDGFVFTVWRFPGLNPDQLLQSAAQARFWVEIPSATVNSSFLAWGQEIRTLGARLPVPVVGCRQEIAQR
jgi:DNA-binding beta-propeller fold protein YncE